MLPSGVPAHLHVCSLLLDHIGVVFCRVAQSQSVPHSGHECPGILGGLIQSHLVQCPHSGGNKGVGCQDPTSIC